MVKEGSGVSGERITGSHSLARVEESARGIYDCSPSVRQAFAWTHCYTKRAKPEQLACCRLLTT
jgi:hypothetical protein